MLSAITGWFAVAILVLYLIGLFYVDTSVKKILKQLANIQLQDESLLSEAKSVREKGFYFRIKWLKANQARFSEDIRNACNKMLRAYFSCYVLIGMVFVALLIAEFLPE